MQVQLYLSGRYDSIPAPGERELLTTEKSKASWELKKGNVGVFAIQGRRPHMEDRFNVVNDLEHTETSIYGIFDGHGGEVAYFIISFAVNKYIRQPSQFSIYFFLVRYCYQIGNRLKHMKNRNMSNAIIIAVTCLVTK